MVSGRWLPGGFLSVCFGQFPYNLPFVRVDVVIVAVAVVAAVAAVAVVFSFCSKTEKKVFWLFFG